jgi:hypothetical protein
MLVDPDFLDHWKTRMLSDTLNDPKAPLYVLRIWAHCQVRRSTEFSMPTEGLRALCQFEGSAETLESAMISSGFIERDGNTIKVPKWAEHNAKLVTAWNNGHKGGRPTNNPTVTQPPVGLTETPVGLTERKPTRLDRTRLDKTREEKIKEDGVSKEKPLSSHDDLPVTSTDSVVTQWNELPGVCHVRPPLSSKRLKTLLARMREPGWLDSLPQALAAIQSNPFFQGKNDRNWRATFDWFIRPDIVTKLVEGQYQSKQPFEGIREWLAESELANGKSNANSNDDKI